MPPGIGSQFDTESPACTVVKHVHWVPGWNKMNGKHILRESGGRIGFPAGVERDQDVPTTRSSRKDDVSTHFAEARDQRPGGSAGDGGGAARSICRTGRSHGRLP